MARPRAFDRAEVLDKATRLFWRRGYGGTSLSDLEAETGIGRTSIYAAFGGKEALFLAAVDHYDATYSIKLRKALVSARSVRAGIEGYFDELLKAFDDPGLPLGCLVTNVGVEGDRGTTKLGRKIAASIGRAEDVFYGFLREGQTRGEVGADVDIRALARYYVSVTHGLSTLAKALPNSSAVHDVAGMIVAEVGARLMPGRRGREVEPIPAHGRGASRRHLAGQR